MLLFPSFSFIVLSSSHTLVSDAHSFPLRHRDQTLTAWNGQQAITAVDAYADTHFTPYYVPSGSVSIDDADPLVQYSPDGVWGKARHQDLVDKTMHMASQAGARVDFTFAGIGIEWFGSLTAKHGIVGVYINDTLQSKVDAYHPTWLKRQRLFGLDHLPLGTHRFSIVNTGKKRRASGGTFFDVDAFVVNPGTSTTAVRKLGLLSALLAPHRQQEQEMAQAPNYNATAQVATRWSLSTEGETGVHAMQLSIISATQAIVIDKVEHNPLTIRGHPAWGALYDLRTNKARPLDLHSNSFCAGGSFLSNGSLVNVGGNPVVVDSTGAADFGDINGLQAVRLFHPDLCDVNGKGQGCDIIEALVLFVWRHQDGTTLSCDSMTDTLNSNLFPIAFLLTDGRVFLAANRDAMIYDWKTNVEYRLPQLPNNVRVTYPMTATAVLLPLSPQNNYLPAILICGGSNVDDQRPGYEIDSQEAASAQCIRMDLSEEGIRHGWEVDQMPEPRVMPDAVLLPTGAVVIINGGATGIAGYGNVKHQVGFSNADNPVLTPVLYNPTAAIGSRFSSAGMPTSDIPRLYHSVATLVPDGRVLITGSNPNLDRTTTRYPTEYRVEWLSPMWMRDSASRPTASASITTLPFGSEFALTIDLKGGDAKRIKVALMDLGFITHSLHMNSRLVYLEYTEQQTTNTTVSLAVKSPPHSAIYPPGPGWIYLVVGDKWSEAIRVLVGDGSSPPSDPDALENMLNHSTISKGSPAVTQSGEGAESI
ncbi:SubName: Full=Related to glyoxaloxidase 2 {ECO:0000313/EMBL:CCA68855.1} [Serendipita indica DSM 11827]|nr:SubName: Full=Related to glyoxaloxidase 2 {ECO:0000313/EMBL:CCA68855.1} [Serendipita indica DSM 11827]